MVRIRKSLYAVPITAVEEVLPALPIEAVPQCPPFIRGVVFVRGHLIPVLDAAERLGLIGGEPPIEPHILCLRIGDRLIGLEVDEALDLFHTEPGASLQASEIGAAHGFFSGVIEMEGNIIRLLSPEDLLAPGEAAALAAIPRTA